VDRPIQRRGRLAAGHHHQGEKNSGRPHQLQSLTSILQIIKAPRNPLKVSIIGPDATPTEQTHARPGK
jgi:hypothetical protein